MIVPDVNLLLYAFNSGSPHYDAARRWWERLVNGTEQVGLPWAVIISIVPINPGTVHLMLAQRIPDAAGGGGDLVPDAHIAALATEPADGAAAGR